MLLSFLFAALAGLVAPAQSPPPDLHVVFTSEFEYMSRVRPMSYEWWIGENRSASRQGDRLSIRRDDLGVTWRIDLKAGSYVETARPAPPAAAGAAAEPAFDIHTAGYDWEPRFDWSVAETGQKSSIAGRPCLEFRAVGDADYAQAWVTFWACDPLPGVAQGPNDSLLGVLRSDSARKMVSDALAAHGNAWVLALEEKQEPAIAPTMVLRAKVELVEWRPAPPGTFDLPSNVKKAGR
jgi:hypothetical protein